MKRFLKCRALSILMAVALLVGMLPVDLLGGVATVSAAETATDSYGIVKTVDGDTTTWDFTQVTTAVDSFAGITTSGITTSGSANSAVGLKAGYIRVYGLRDGNTNTGAIALDLDSATTSVELTITLTGTGSADATYGDRYVTVGNDSKNVIIHHAKDGGTYDNTFADKTWTGTFDSSYFTDGTLVIAGGVGENKIGSISMTETKSAGTSGGDAGSGAAVEFKRTYDFRDGSIVPTDTTNGNTEMSSADGRLTVKPGTTTGFKYNGAQHGVAFGSGNSIVIKVQKGSGTISLGTCSYSETSDISVTMNGETLTTLTTTKTGDGSTCYEKDTTNNVLSVDYTCEAEEAEVEFAFANTTYLPIILVSGTEPKPEVTEVTATITVNDENSLLQDGDTITLVNAADAEDKHDITNASSDELVLDVNATYNIVSSNSDIAATAGGKTTVVTTTENLEVTVDLTSTVVRPIVTIVDEENLLGDGKVTLTNNADANDSTTVTDGDAVKLKIGATYKVASTSAAAVATIAGSKLLTVSEDLTAIQVDIAEVDTTHHTIDVWDFGAEQLANTDLITYNNKLTEDIINGWYAGVEAGTKGKNIASFEVLVADGAVELAFDDGGYSTTHRLRSKNTNITRYDDKSLTDIEDSSVIYNGYIYSNKSATDEVNVQIAAKAGDIFTIAASSNGAGSDVTWRSPSGVETSQFYGGKSSYAQKMTFYAAEDGLYTLYSATEKIVVARIYRERPTEVTVSGSVSVPEGADLNGATIVFTNQTTGQEIKATNTNGSYSAALLEQYTYNVSLEGANGYIVGANNTLKLKNEAGDTKFDVEIIEVDLVEVSGSLADLTAEDAAKLELTFTSDNVYIPEFAVVEGTSNFTAVLERNVTYELTAEGVDDYTLDSTTIMASAEGTQNIKFTKKPVYAVNLTLEGPTAEEAANAAVVFSRLDDEVLDGTLDGYTYLFTGTENIALRDGQYKVEVALDGYTQQITSDVKVNGAAVDKTVVMKSDSEASETVEYKEVLTVGANGEYQTINDALDAVRHMTREEGQRVTIAIEPGNYEEMLVIDVDDVTLQNTAGEAASIELTNSGVDIAENAVRITSYYGHGYTYYSMGSDCKYDEELLKANKENGYPSFKNPGSGSTAGSYWNATVVVGANGFEADGIIFENSFNQYVSEKAANDIIVAQDSAKEGSVARADMEVGDTTVQNKSYVERAAALAIKDNFSGIKFDNCKFVGRQDTLYGGKNAYVEFYECSIYGGTDYIFGGMVALFYRCDLVFNTSEDKNDVGYITAAQQTAGRGYLMYECYVTSTQPGVDTASKYTSKPGYFGRPWAANTSEVVFYRTNIDAADEYWHNNAESKTSGKSLIAATGWDSTLSGESAGMYEYDTFELSGVDNSAARVAWATMLTEAVLNDGTEIAIDAFVKAEPIEGLYELDLANGLLKGVIYDGGISVLEDMPMKDDGFIQGTNNPKTASGSGAKGEVPATGAALILTAEKDGYLKCDIKENGKTAYFVDATTGKYESYTQGSTGSLLKTFEVQKGHTYYLYANGSKICFYSITVDYREPYDWNTVATPVLGTPIVSGGDIVVPFEALVGGLNSESLEVRMLQNGEIIDTISYVTESEEGSVAFTPDASGSYTFVGILRRSGMLGKTSNTTDAVEFVLPMHTPVIVNVENQGSGNVKFMWQEVPEADEYEVYLDGVYQETVAVPYARFSGLTVGQTYEFGVKAVGNNDTSDMATMTQTISDDAQKSWLFSAFGSGVNTSDNAVLDGIDSAEDTTLTIKSLNGKGKLVPASTDGLAFYYTTIDPETENFILEADVTVDEWKYSNGQEGFGLMVADAVGTNGDSSTFWNNSYMNAVTKVEYLWDETAQAVADAGTKYSMRLGVGSQEKIGVSQENLEEIQNGNLEDFKSTMTTLETSAAWANLGAGNYNLAANYTNTDADTGVKVIEGVTDMDNLQTTFHLTIQRNNTGYILSYTDADGNTTSKKYYHGDDGDELTKIDPNNIYVGFFASRNAKITATNVSLTTSNPETDPAAEPRPTTYVTPSYAIVSAGIANNENYELVYYGNADGKLTVKLVGETLVDAADVTAKTKYRVPATLKSGENTFDVTFTPNEDYKPSKYEELSSYEAASFTHTVTYKEFERDVIYVGPNGTSSGKGTKYSPMDIYTAVKYVQPGDKIILLEGTYNLRSTVTVERGIDGTADNMIYMMADPDAETRPVLDFSNACAGMVFAGDYWYIKGFDVTNSLKGQKGVQISGSYNTVDDLKAYRNGNTGIQISRFKSSDEWEDWPSNNLILNCTSYLNADAGYEDADGFAAKLTVADGNVFDGCIAAYNADDGWDLFAKIESGLIGQVTIKNSIAFKNGYDITASGEEIIAGNGNGFKMGGSSMSGKHILENSVAFANRAKGIDSNSCPDIIVRNSTSFDNLSYNVAFYTNDAKNTDFDARGVLSYKISNEEGENLKPKGSQDETKIYDASNYYFYGDASKNAEGDVVTDDWFIDLDVDAAINGGISRNADGTIDMNGFLELTDAAPANVGATITGVSSGDVEVPTVPSTGVTVDTTAVTMEIGDTVELEATLTPDDTTDGYVWSSDNAAVATVSKDGLVTAIAAGKATITVTTTSGKTAICTVVVNAPAIVDPEPTTTPEPTATPAPVTQEEQKGVTYKVSGSGVTISKIDKNATTVTIPTTITTSDGRTYKVTSIAKNAAKGNTKLTKVVIGSNITSIGDYAFYGCKNLKSVTIGKNVTTIGKCAFAKNTSLTKITIPDKVKTVGSSAFDGCTKLKTVKLGKSLTAISDKMFYKCSSLTKVTIPSKVTKIGKSAFASCTKLASVTIGKKVSSIGSSAFYKCTSLKKVTIPSSVKTIGGSAFSGCTKLATLTIGSKVATIDKNAFYKCTALNKVTIPASVKTIGANAFNGCKNLKSITIKTTKLTTKTVGNKSFSGIHAKATIKVPSKKLADYKTLLLKKGVKKSATIKK